MKLLGVTGGIGMGKTTVARIMARHGAAVADTDEISHRLTRVGQPALGRIREVFGGSFFKGDGSLDRGALAGIVFNDGAAREKLESILHPTIRETWMTEAQKWREEGRRVGVVVIPLLFETEAQKHFDAVICAACSGATMERRLSARGWTREQMASRAAAQWPVEKKIAASDYVIWTDTTLEATEAQVRVIIDSTGKGQRTPACG